MAEFTFFFGTWEDSWLLMERLVGLRRFRFIVGMPYPSSSPILTEFEELGEDTKVALRHEAAVLLWSDAYSRWPPTLRPAVQHDKLRIDEVRSGPMLRLELPHEVQEEGRLRLTTGVLLYQPYYENPKTGELLRPPAALKSAYQEVRAALRRQMTKRHVQMERLTTRGEFKPYDQPIWLGPHALTSLVAGTTILRMPSSPSGRLVTIAELE